MKTLYFLLILAAFLQSSILPLNLCLIILIAQNFASERPQSLLVAFFAGIFLSILTAQNLGFWPLIFIAVVEIIYLVKKLPLLANSYVIFLGSFLILGAVSAIEKLILKSSVSTLSLFISSFLVIVFHFLIKFFAGRYITSSQLKLKINEKI